MKKDIEKLMVKYRCWGLFDNLTEPEVEQIECDLKQLCGTAIMEANNAIQNVLPTMYREITKN